MTLIDNETQTIFESLMPKICLYTGSNKDVICNHIWCMRNLYQDQSNPIP